MQFCYIGFTLNSDTFDSLLLEHLVFIAPGEPDVRVKISRGYNYTNLTVEWTPTNTFLPLEKTKLVVVEGALHGKLPLISTFVLGV